MCHEYTSRVWTRDRDEEETAADEELPGFANEDGGDDVEVLTDGGDES